MSNRTVLLALSSVVSLLVCSLWELQSFAKQPSSAVSPGKTSQSKSKPLGTTAKAAEGKRLFAKLQCADCHSIQGKGGCLAPPLDGIAGRRSEAYIKLRLGQNEEDKFIKEMGHPELFPHPRFSATTVSGLSTYLRSLPNYSLNTATTHPHSGKAIAETPLEKKDFTPLPPTADSREGRRLFLEGGCMACHAIGQFGGVTAPRLDGIGARHSRAYIEAHIGNPQAHEALRRNGKRQSQMPQFEFQDVEVKQITDYLLTLPRQEVVHVQSVPAQILSHEGHQK